MGISFALICGGFVGELGSLRSYALSRHTLLTGDAEVGLLFGEVGELELLFGEVGEPKLRTRAF